MFRKILNSIVIVALIIGTTGVSISKHYCGNTLVSVSLNHQDKGCGMKGNCCHSETVLYKVTDNFAASHFEYKSPLSHVIALLHVENDFNKNQNIYSNQNFYSFSGAPPISNCPSFLRVFRC